MIQSLGIAMSGLTAAQRGIEVVSHNIANVNTPGYARQRLDQVAAFPTMGTRAIGPGAYGTGVEVTGVRQLRDTLLENAARGALANQGTKEEIDRAMSSIQHIAGSLDDGLSSDLSRLWSALSEVTANPQGITPRSAVIDAGNRLAATLRTASARVEHLASDSGERLGGYVGQVTALAKQVAALNQSILNVTTAGGTPNDFIDQRGLALEQLAKLTGGEVRPSGAIVDVTVGGAILVSGVHSSAMTADGLPPVVKVDGGTVTAGGAIGALQSLATTGLNDLRQRLDLVANGLRDGMNAVHASGTDLDGNAGMAFFTGTGATDIAVNAGLGPRQIAASLTGKAADGNNAQKMADVRYAKIIGTLASPSAPTLSAGDAVADLVSDLGQRAAAAQRELDASSAMVTSLDDQRQATGGVSIDEEMTNLLKYQRAYEAAARIITAADQMLDTLVNRTGLVGR